MSPRRISVAYFDHNSSSNSREGWKYTYKGSELAEAAKFKYNTYLTAERDARNKLSELVKDVNVSQDSAMMKQTRERAEINAKEREACSVYVHEFERNPDREYNLSLGDVVYFCLIKRID